MAFQIEFPLHAIIDIEEKHIVTSLLPGQGAEHVYPMSMHTIHKFRDHHAPSWWCTCWLMAAAIFKVHKYHLMLHHNLHPIELHLRSVYCCTTSSQDNTPPSMQTTCFYSDLCRIIITISYRSLRSCLPKILVDEI